MKPLKSVYNSLQKGEILLPAIKKFLLEEASELVGGKILGSDIVKEDARLTISTFKERIKEYNHDKKIKGEYFHPSAIGVCLRKMWFECQKAPENDGVFSGDTLLKQHITFEIGTYVHVLFQNLCDRAGLLKEREVSIVSKSLKIIGHADGIVTVNGEDYVLEIKTINSRGFISLNDAKDAHKKQMMCYAKALGLRKGIIIYIDKDRSSLKEYVVPFDSKVYSLSIRPRIDKFFKYLRDGTLPDKEGVSPNTFPCSYCPFTNVCYHKVFLDRWLKEKRRPLKIKKKKKKK